jgi:hypothetical protein
MEQDIEESILHGILEQRIPLEEHDTESKTNSKDKEILSTHDSEKTTQPQITIKNDATSLFVLQLGPEDGSQSEDETQDFGAQSPQAATNNNSNNNDEKNDHSTSNNTSNNGINNENNLKDKDKSPNRRQDDKKETTANVTTPNNQTPETKGTPSVPSTLGQSEAPLTTGTLQSRRSSGGRPFRYFIVKSLSMENLEISVRKGVWATQPHNEPKFNEAFSHAEVILIFSVNNSGHFQGYGRMSSRIGTKVSRVWHGAVRCGGLFRVEWLSVKSLPFEQTQHLRNPLNQNKPVKIARDGQELPPDVGRQLVLLIDQYGQPDRRLHQLFLMARAAQTQHRKRALDGDGADAQSSLKRAHVDLRPADPQHNVETQRYTHTSDDKKIQRATNENATKQNAAVDTRQKLTETTAERTREIRSRSREREDPRSRTRPRPPCSPRSREREGDRDRDKARDRTREGHHSRTSESSGERRAKHTADLLNMTYEEYLRSMQRAHASYYDHSGHHYAYNGPSYSESVSYAPYFTALTKPSSYGYPSSSAFKASHPPPKRY